MSTAGWKLYGCASIPPMWVLRAAGGTKRGVLHRGKAVQIPIKTPVRACVRRLRVS